MRQITSRSWRGFFAILLFLSISGCDRNPLSRLTLGNYDKITVGMSKAQVEQILGPPTTVETKDMIIFSKTTYKYQAGEKFAMITFKNNEVDGKESNLGR